VVWSLHLPQPLNKGIKPNRLADFLSAMKSFLPKKHTQNLGVGRQAYGVASSQVQMEEHPLS
jgi:hypothetical protein